MFRPEEREERISPMRPTRRGQRKVAEEGDPLRLDDYGAKLMSF
jgi:hypothetical protein